ncbi:MAG: hypothetical protein IPM91_22565 [Bacteroidetes bacterium]|nr:hypothetical protein [Bacteroidota bacterium]
MIRQKTLVLFLFSLFALLPSKGQCNTIPFHEEQNECIGDISELSDINNNYTFSTYPGIKQLSLKVNENYNPTLQQLKSCKKNHFTGAQYIPTLYSRFSYSQFFSYRANGIKTSPYYINYRSLLI